MVLIMKVKTKITYIVCNQESFATIVAQEQQETKFKLPL